MAEGNITFADVEHCCAIGEVPFDQQDVILRNRIHRGMCPLIQGEIVARCAVLYDLARRSIADADRFAISDKLN